MNDERKEIEEARATIANFVKGLEFPKKEGNFVLVIMHVNCEMAVEFSGWTNPDCLRQSTILGLGMVTEDLAKNESDEANKP